MVGVSKNTVTNWVEKGNWITERSAKQMSDQNIRQSGKEALENLSQILLELQNKRSELKRSGSPDKAAIEELDEKIISYTHAIANTAGRVNKLIEGNKITLTIYLQVMEDIFNALLQEDSKLHAQTLDFQESHILFVAKKLG